MRKGFFKTEKTIYNIYMPNTRRITDITSRRHKKKERPKTPERREGPRFSFSVVKLSIGAIFIVVIISVGVLHVFFATAQLSITPKTRALEMNAVITASTEASSVSIETLTIPARLFEKEIEATRLFPSTGSAVREASAKGTIKVFNERSVNQILITNTRFVSEGGMLFRTTKRIVVPPLSSLNVEVVAAEPGSTYNIGPSNFSVPGLSGSSLYTLVYGKSSSSMKGGSTGESTVVTGEDIEKAKEELTSSIIKQAQDVITAELPSSFVLTEQAFVSEILEADTPVKSGAALDQFNYTASVRVRAIGFQKEYIYELARQLLAVQLQKGELINEQTLDVQYTTESVRQGTGTARLKATISAVAYEDIDVEKIEASILGKTMGEVELILRAQQGISNFTISLWPFWIQGVPVDSERAHVRLILD